MHRGHSPSWQVRCVFPEYLQLSGYIAQQERFRPEINSRVVTHAEIEWQLWWEAMLHPLEPFANLPNQTDPWQQVNYDPPDFARLAHWPAIQSLCQRHFPDFHQRWGIVGGEKERMTGLMHDQLQRVRIDKIVKACTAVAGKRQSAPFDLTVDFVQWPADYQRISNNACVVLGKQYVEHAQAAELRELLSSIIAPLI